MFFDYFRHFGCGFSEKNEYLEYSFEPRYDLMQHEIPAVQAPISVKPAIDSTDDTARDTDTYCDSQAPPVSIAEGIYVDHLQLENAFFTKRAFWALFVPALVRDLDMDPLALNLLKIVVQKVLWTIESRVMLWIPNLLNKNVNQADTSRNNIDKTKSEFPNAQSEGDGFLNALHAVQNLECDYSDSVEKCLTRYLAVLRHQSYISNSVVEILKAWFKIPKTEVLFNPDPPTFKDRCTSKDVKFHAVKRKKYDSKSHFKSTGRYDDNNQKESVPYTFVPTTNVEAMEEHLVKTCATVNEIDWYRLIDISQPWTRFNDILLVVIFNIEHYDVLPSLEVLYRPFFPNILYCGPGLPSKQQEALLGMFKYSFVQYEQVARRFYPGSSNYQCVAMGMAMSYDVTGYLAIGDDVIMSLPKLNDFPRDTIWFINSTCHFRCDVFKETCRSKKNHVNINDPIFWFHKYKEEAQRSSLTMSNRPSDSAEFRCFNRIKELSQFENAVYFEWCDFYYVPHSFSEDFISLAQHFTKFSMHLELAVTTMLMCLDDPSRRQEVLPTYIWTRNRNKPWLHFDALKKGHFLHPAKWSPLLKRDKETANFYCNTVLPHLHNMAKFSPRAPRGTQADLEDVCQRSALRLLKGVF